MIPTDLFFTYIKIRATRQNALVCKSWYKTLSYKLRQQKIQYYDKKIYDTIVAKLYDTDTSIYRSQDIQSFSKHYYDTLLHNIMQTIIHDNSLSIIKKNMIEYYNTFHILYLQYDDMNIAEEYNRLLCKYYNLNLCKMST